MERIGKTIAETVRATLPPTWKTCVWIVEITAAVSAGILVMRYLGILPLVSDALAPFFRLFGLPGEAAMAYVSGYFVNVYSAIAVAVAMGMGPREMTILAIMVLTSHNMIVETAVQKKTGTSAVRMVLLRTLSGLFLGMLMNLLLPGGGRDAAPSAGIAAGGDFMGLFVPWLKDTALLLSKMVVIIFSLNILQALLAEFGVIRAISRFLRPLLKIFGLPPRCSFLWIIANTVGLAYGAAAMIDETRKSKITGYDIDLLNTHIAVSHSNVEDIALFASVGALWWVLLLSRVLWAVLMVWCYRLWHNIRNKFISLQVPDSSGGNL